MQSIFIKNRRNHTNLTTTWEQREFNSVFTMLQNNTLSRAELVANNGAAMNVHYGDILVKFGEVLDLEIEALPYIESEQVVSKFKSSLLQNGDVIVADTAEDEAVGKCTEIANLSDVAVISGLHTIPLRPQQKFASGYLGYYLNSNSYHDTLVPLMQGTKVTSISKSALQGTSICYPTSYEEQQQIGTYFRNLDNLITLHQRKYSLLFIRTFEILKEACFFLNVNAWEQRKVLDLLVQPVTDGPHETPELVEEGIPFISVDAIVDNKIDFDRKRGYITEAYNRECCKKYKPQLLDVFLVKSGSTVGKVAIVDTTDNFNIWSPLAALRCGEKTSPYFLYFLLQTRDMQAQVSDKASNGTQPNLSMRELEKFGTIVPASIDEQKAIGNYFKSLDHLITLHQRKPFQRKNGGKNYVRRC